jgi:hypothetical protein
MRRELVAGAILALLVRGPWTSEGWRHSLVGRASIIVGVNLLYERFLDGNGWNATDVGQRFVGSAGVEIMFRVSR